MGQKVLEHKTVAIALSGGGAKGAYHVGMMRALEEAGLDRSKLRYSGTSIGAMNAVYLACHGVDALREMFYAFDQSAGDQTEPTTPFSVVQKAQEDVVQGRVALDEFVNDSRFWAMDPAPLLDYYRKTLPDDVLAKNTVPVTVCCYSLLRREPVHFPLNGLPPEEQRQLILASGSLPYVFPPTQYHGDVLLDGGVVPEILLHEKPSKAVDELRAAIGAETGVGREVEALIRPHEKIPVPAMCEMLEKEKSRVDILIGAFLNRYDVVETPAEGENGVCGRYLELRPSVPLEEKPGSGTLDFRPAVLDSHEKLGYADTVRILSTL